MLDSWTGEIDIAKRWALFVGTGATTQVHAHAAHKLVVGSSDGTSVEGGALLGSRLWLVRSHVRHRVSAQGKIALLFLDAAFVDEVDLAASGDSTWRLAELLIDEANPDARAASVAGWVSSLPEPRDPRARDVALALLADPLVSAEVLSSRGGLSWSRLTHVFKERVGISPRQYRTWAAFRAALEKLGARGSLTSLAYDAGFADSAHLSRVFSQMIGIAPSRISSASVIRVRD